jgi:HSP20 family protein
MFDMFNFHRQIDRLFNQMWSDLAAQPATSRSPEFQVRSTADAWKVSVPLPGVDPKHVALEAAGHTLTIRVEQPERADHAYARFEQTITVPQFVDLDKVSASHRHGLLELTLPLKDAVKPRTIQIDSAATSDTKQLHA